MADKVTRVPDANPDETAQRLEEPVPAPADPGGAHAKGYSADPNPEADVPAQDPLPLAPGPAKHPATHEPERDDHVQATGRSKPQPYSPNDRLMGSDR